MDFFEHQQQAKKRTVLLVVLYTLGVIALVSSVGILLVLGIAASEGGLDQESIGVIVAVVGILFFIIVGASLFKSAQLSAGGGKMIAESLGGRRIAPNTSDPAERRLYNVVEEMSLASGVPVPTIYIMDNEHSINAFAAGLSSNAAVVGCNRGTVELLTRDELQGVIAHEFSHILNGDMRMNLRLIGILFGLQVLALIGYFAMRIGLYVPQNSRSSNDKGASAGIGMALLVAGLVVMIIGYVGVFFSSLIQAAISRQREFLADASAVQFTRNPAGIAGALKKIGCPKIGSQMQSPNAPEASHLFFGNASSLFSFGNLLATHPPLPIRIKRIEPAFDGRFPAEIYPVNIARESETARQPQSAAKPATIPIPVPMGIPTGIPVGASALSSLSPENVAAAATVLNGIPQDIDAAARDPLLAIAAFFALLLDDDTMIRQRQLTVIRTDFIVKETLRLYPQMKVLPEELKIPVAQRVSSALRSLSKEQYVQFVSAIDKMIAADNKVDLFEYTLKAMLLRDLDIYFGLARQLSGRYTAFPQIQDSLVAVLSFLAYSGHDNAETATQAFNVSFAKGFESLPRVPSILPPSQTTIAGFDKGLRQLAETSPALKKQVWSAFQICVRFDGQITAREAELLRAIAAMLAIPC